MYIPERSETFEKGETHNRKIAPQLHFATYNVKENAGLRGRCGGEIECELGRFRISSARDGTR
jgi:hypothetical protein